MPISQINTNSIANGAVVAADLAAGAARANFGAGAVLQVVQVVKTDAFAGTPGAVWADVSGLSVAITPSSTSSRILIIVDLKGSGTSNSSIIRSRLLRNGSAIYVGDASSNRPRSLGQFYVGGASDNGFYLAQIGGTFVDSPATTSAVTYNLQIGADDTTRTVYVNRTNNDRDTIYYDSRSASSITLLEIAG